MSRIRRVAVPVLALLLAVGSVRAQSAASVTKAVKAAAKAELKQLRADFAEHVALFDEAVDDFEEAVVEAALAPFLDLAPAAQELAATWGTLQLAGMQSITEHQESFALAASAALAPFQEAEDALAGPYPAGCHAGGGGGADDFIAGWRKEQDKARAKMELRLEKSRKLLVKKAGIALGVQTRAPILHAGLVFNADLDSADSDSTTLPTFGVDLMLTLDPVDGSGDALVLVTGFAQEGDLVDIFGEGSNSIPGFTNQVATPGNRWVLVFSNVTEGNYVLFISNLTSLVGTIESLGVG